jgi:hypothetical protein
MALRSPPTLKSQILSASARSPGSVIWGGWVASGAHPDACAGASQHGWGAWGGLGVLLPADGGFRLGSQPFFQRFSPFKAR